MINKIINVLKDVSKNSEEISNRTNKNRLLIEIDMIRCLIKYKASPNNYKYFNFCQLTDAQKSTYVTYGISQQMISQLNDNNYIDYFEDKIKFAETFKDFYKRDYVSTQNISYVEFLNFVDGKKQFICKPVGGSQGQGIKVFHVNDNLEDIYNEIIAEYSDGYMLEDWINQHEVLSNIYPNAVNCLRIITVFDGVKNNLLTGGVTFDTETEIANGSQPSIIAPVDMQTGKIYKPAATFFSECYDKHPTTNSQILGVQLPYWDEIKDMLNMAGRIVKNVRYIGWDVAITPDGPVIIEANTTPGYKYYQIPAHCEGGIGNKSIYIKYLK